MSLCCWIALLCMNKWTKRNYVVGGARHKNKRGSAVCMYVNTYADVCMSIHMLTYMNICISIHKCRSKSKYRYGWYMRGGGLGSSTFSKNLKSPTPRRKWYLTTGRRAHWMVIDFIPQSLPVHFFGSRPQPPTSLIHTDIDMQIHEYICTDLYLYIYIYIYI